jgi:hypothetical protein
MNVNPTEEVWVVLFAAIGACAVLYLLVRLSVTVWRIAVNLNATLKEAVAVLKEYRGDFQFLRQLQEAASRGPNFGEVDSQAEVQEPKQPKKPLPPFPEPLYDRFTTKPKEPDAEAENADVTGDDREMVDRERVDNLKDMGFDAEEPEVRPPGRMVDAS